MQIYPKAPAHTAEEVYQMIFPIYQDLIEIQQIDPKKIIFMGDSAGGGLALAFAEFIKLKKFPHPRQIMLLFPWLDISNENPDVKKSSLLNLFWKLDQHGKWGNDMQEIFL